MNISLTPFNLKLASPTNYFSRNNTISNNNYGNTKLAPLAQDVVSFSGKAKKAVVEEPDVESSLKRVGILWFEVRIIQLGVGHVSGDTV